MRISDWSSDVCSSDLGSAVFGLALSVASTVVLLRALQARDMVETEKGRIAVGWLIVEDLVMVLALVLLPAMFGGRGDGGGFGGGAGLLQSAALVLIKGVGFGAVQLGRADVCTPITNAPIACRMLRG